MSKINKVIFPNGCNTECYEMGETLHSEYCSGKITNMEFINPDRKSGDYGVRIETDKNHFIIISNPIAIFGQDSTGENNG